jgi:glycosyltransferase involved in cell wall biosynthesis
MHISVVVPFHNSAEFIEACTRALLSQRYPRDAFEIIMIDNNSTDGSAAIVRRYPEIKLFTETKPGSYAARNRGVREARGAIIAFTDSDCAPGPDWLQTIWKAMAVPGLALIQGRCYLGSGSLPLALLADYEAKKAAYTFTSQKKELYYGYTNNMAIRRDVYDRVGPFQEWMRGADVMLVHRVLDEYSCSAVTYLPDMWVQHLEVNSVGTWLRKMHIYGRSFRRYGDLVRIRPLRREDRWRVLQATIHDNRYSLARSSLLVCLLSIGVISYELGRRTPLEVNAGC